MASNKFDYQFITEPDESLKCSICLEVAVDPKQEEGCGKLFCRECIRKNGSQPCPNCRTGHPNYYNDKKSKVHLGSPIAYVASSYVVKVH